MHKSTHLPRIMVWLALPNWLPDDSKSQSDGYKRTSGPVSERKPGPVDASGILVRQTYAKSEIRQMYYGGTQNWLSERLSVTTIPNQSDVDFIFGFEQLRPLRPFSLFIYLGTILQNYNGGPFGSESERPLDVVVSTQMLPQRWSSVDVTSPTTTKLPRRCSYVDVATQTIPVSPIQESKVIHSIT